MSVKSMARAGSLKRCAIVVARSAGLLAAGLMGFTAVPAASPDGPAALHVAVDRAGSTISRDVFGQFAEHLGTGIYGGVWVGPDSPIPNVRGIRSDVVAALRAIRVPNVRWPGGCFADDYHWHDGIGPRAQRPARLNAGWGGVIEPNQFGTAEYFDFLQQIGAEAYLSVNVGSGTAAEAADWLEYMTADKPTALAQERGSNGHPAPYRLAYLGLGNENWGCGGAMSTDHYVEEMKRFAHYTRNLDPAQTGAQATKKVAVGWDGLNDGKSDYTEAVLKAWKAKVYSWDIDGISLHNYAVGGWPPHLPATGFGVDDYYTLMGEALLMEPKVAREAALMDRYDPDKKLFVAVDEWGAWLAPTPGSHPGFLQQQNSMRDAVLAAATLNIFMRHADRVRMANIAQMANVLQSMVLTDGPHMVLTPTYHVFHLYLPFQGATFVPVALEAGRISHGSVSLPRMDAVAARDGQGRLWLAVTNLDPERSGSVALDDTVRSAAGQLLSAARIDAVNSFAAPNAVAPRPVAAEAQGGHLRLTLPPAAVAVVELKPR